MLEMTIQDALFHSLAGVATVSALLVVLLRNPVYSALFLALTMSVLGALFFTLEAYFVAAAQITVYAGAVMVLFVMVLMLFDWKHEGDQVFKLSPLGIVKILSVALLGGLLVGSAVVAIGAKSMATPALEAKVKIEEPKTTGVNNNTTAQSPTLATDEDLSSAESMALVDSKLANTDDTQQLAEKLFTKYVFAFEVISVLLLLAIVGVVALARSKGGTHHVAH